MPINWASIGFSGQREEIRISALVRFPAGPDCKWAGMNTLSSSIEKKCASISWPCRTNSVRSSFRMRQDEQEETREHFGTLQAGAKLNAIEEKGGQLTAEKLHAEEQLRQAKAREIEIESKIVELKIADLKVTKETGVAQKDTV